jgi:opacity protein-like surface antigen
MTTSRVMKKINIGLLAACLLSAGSALAQSSFSIQYSMATGSGDMKSYISNLSFRGITLEYRYRIQPKFSVGAEAGWNVFYQKKDFATYTDGTTSLSGVQYRYINAVPLFLTGDFYLRPGEKINPFVGVGIGTLYTKRNTDMGLYTLPTETWAFALRPQVGVLIEANPALDFIIVGKYNAGFSTSSQAAQSYFTLNLGLVFKSQP